MPTVRFPAVMKYYVNNQSEFAVPASTVNELVSKVIEQYPSIRFHLVDSNSRLRKHFNVFVNGTHIRDLDGMDTPLSEADQVILMALAAGGLSDSNFLSFYLDNLCKNCKILVILLNNL